jgi:hypothetical protein
MACQKIENLVLVAMGFFHTNSWPKATNTLGKKPHITLKKSLNSSKMYLKSLAILGKTLISLKNLQNN